MDSQLLRRIRFPLANRRTAIILCLAMTAAIAFADWVITPNASLRLLYFIPMLLVAAHLKPGEIALLAAENLQTRPP